MHSIRKAIVENRTLLEGALRKLDEEIASFFTPKEWEEKHRVAKNHALEIIISGNTLLSLLSTAQKEEELLKESREDIRRSSGEEVSIQRFGHEVVASKGSRKEQIGADARIIESNRRIIEAVEGYNRKVAAFCALDRLQRAGFYPNFISLDA